MTDRRACHLIASKAGSQIVREGIEAGLEWADIAIACETTITIVVAAVIELQGQPRNIALATELMNTMTERAHQRLVAHITRVPYDG